MSKLFQSIRDAVNTPYRGHKNILSSLNDRQLAEVYLKLKRGQEISAIAVSLKNDWGLYKSRALKDVEVYLSIFKKLVLSPIDQISIDPNASKREKKEITFKAQDIVESLDAMGSLRWLITEETERLKLWRDRERLLKLPIAGTEDTIKTLGKLLNDYIKLEVDLGLVESKQKSIRVNVQHNFESMIKNNLPEEGRNLLSATSSFLKSVEEEGITLTQNEEGVYIPRRGDDIAEEC